MSDKTHVSNNFLFLFIGVGFLFIGVLEYLLHRPFDSSYIGKFLTFNSLLSNDRVSVFGILCGVIPDFIHPLAFSLLSMGLFYHCVRGLRVLICSSWLLIDLIFELGQRYHHLFNQFLSHILPENRILNLISGYFISGTYDNLDVLAIIFGALGAFLISELISERRCNCP